MGVAGELGWATMLLRVRSGCSLRRWLDGDGSRFSRTEVFLVIGVGRVGRVGPGGPEGLPGGWDECDVEDGVSWRRFCGRGD
jgi:hypothetical protein